MLKHVEKSSNMYPSSPLICQVIQKHCAHLDPSWLARLFRSTFPTTMRKRNRFALRSQKLHHPSFAGLTHGQSIVRKGDRVDGTQAVMLEALVEQEESVAGGLFVSLWSSSDWQRSLWFRCICLQTLYSEVCLVDKRTRSDDCPCFICLACL